MTSIISTFPLCSETTKSDLFYVKKNIKEANITKQPHDYSGYASNYNVELLNYLNPKLNPTLNLPL